MNKPLKKDIEDNGYHIFSIEKNQEHNYYPGIFNNYPGVSLKILNLNDMITVKVFYINESELNKTISDIYVDLLVIEIADYAIKAMVLTPLPPNCPIKREDILEISEAEILYNVSLKDIQINSSDSVSLN